MTDQIQLRGIKVLAHCGVTKEERDVVQPFEIDLDLDLDQSKAGKSDELNDTADYGLICDLIEKVVAEKEFSLMERFAQVIVDLVFEIDDLIEQITLTLKKLEPPVNVEITSAGVCISRSRN